MQDAKFQRTITELVDTGSKLIEEASKNKGIISPDLLGKLSRNIRQVAGLSWETVRKYKRENHEAHCTVSGYLALVISMMRTNHIAKGKREGKEEKKKGAMYILNWHDTLAHRSFS